MEIPVTAITADPAKPEKPSSGSGTTGNPSAAETNDNNTPVLWAGLVVATGVSLAGITVYRRKRTP